MIMIGNMLPIPDMKDTYMCVNAQRYVYTQSKQKILQHSDFSYT